jgi:uncharacterized membrane protein
MNSFAYLWRSRFLPIALFNGVIYLLAGLLTSIPEVTGPVGLVLGLVNFMSINSIHTDKMIWKTTRTILVILLGSFLGVLFLGVACFIPNQSICRPNNFNAIIFGFFAYAQIMVIGLLIGTNCQKKH